MAWRARKKPDAHLALQIVRGVLKILTGLLVFVGKPLFFLLSHLIIAILFLAYVVGHTARISFIYLLNLKPAKIKLPEVRLKKRKSFLLLSWLKIKLQIIKVVSLLSKIRLPKVKALPKILTFFGFVFFLTLLFWLTILKDLPSPRTLLTREQEVSTKIYDRNGTLLYKIYKDNNRTIVSLSRVPLHV
ncbi:hypothetical protein HY503_00070, partial [Candidatus Woesebacteria bacterium]|nr:hypothetical protein [Candidatus Woesebacteria bacterium]